MSRRDQCRCKTDDTVDVVEEMRFVAAVVVDDPKPVRLEVVDDAKPITLEVVEETAFVTVDVVEEVKPPPPLSATGVTPVGDSVVKNRWNGPLSPGGSPLGTGAGDQTMTSLCWARSNSASGMASIASEAAGTSRLPTSGTQKSDAAAAGGGVEGVGAFGRNDAVRVGRGAAEGAGGLFAGTLCRYGEKTS
jgi:hypothetical protein